MTSIINFVENTTDAELDDILSDVLALEEQCCDLKLSARHEIPGCSGFNSMSREFYRDDLFINGNHSYDEEPIQHEHESSVDHDEVQLSDELYDVVVSLSKTYRTDYVTLSDNNINTNNKIEDSSSITTAVDCVSDYKCDIPNTGCQINLKDDDFLSDLSWLSSLSVPVCGKQIVESTSIPSDKSIKDVELAQNPIIEEQRTQLIRSLDTSPQPSQVNQPQLPPSTPSPTADNQCPCPSYVQMISTAILSSDSKRFILSELCDKMVTMWPNLDPTQSTWRNSVRHCLSTNCCFHKTLRAPSGRGHYWEIHPACMDMFIRGDYRLREANHIVKKLNEKDGNRTLNRCNRNTRFHPYGHHKKLQEDHDINNELLCLMSSDTTFML